VIIESNILGSFTEICTTLTEPVVVGGDTPVYESARILMV
jgi:hypothetical protein